MIYPAIPLAQTILQLCKQHQIKNIVISPGSRNAPLTIGFTHDDYFTCYSMVDERAAAFFAMGMAQQTGHPVALVCTSGSALLNYYPAIAEAFYSDIPLLVISADRPTDKIDIGDGQTIRQANVFANHILYSANLREDVPFTVKVNGDGKHQIPALLNVTDATQLYNETEIAKAIHTAILEKGPVHINAPFEEPLYKTLEVPTVTVGMYTLPTKDNTIGTEVLETFTKDWNASARKMILVGTLAPEVISAENLAFLAADSSVLVFTETTSNLHHEHFFPGIDKILAPVEKLEEKLLELQPDMLLTFGGMIVSKKIKAFLRTYKPEHHYHIDEKKAYDTFFCLKAHLKSDVNTVISYLKEHGIRTESAYRPGWLAVQTQRRAKHEDYLQEIQYCDFMVFSEIFKAIPNKQQLQLSNSSVIRYSQLFELNTTWKVFCNRGTSGIDGSTSTAMGAALLHKDPTTFITGDLSFLYDSNGLWNNYIRKDFTLIVINNGGGGIFRILPGNKNTPEFDAYFETTHTHKANHLAAMFGFTYESATDSKQLSEALTKAYTHLEQREKPLLLEIFTPRLYNDGVLLNYFKYLAN